MQLRPHYGCVGEAARSGRTPDAAARERPTSSGIHPVHRRHVRCAGDRPAPGRAPAVGADGQPDARPALACGRAVSRRPRARGAVLSLRAAGAGLDLQEASYVFHFDRWWNPAVEDQATDRSHRFGQHRPVHVYTYTMESTVEERTVEVLRGKRLLFDEIVEGAGIRAEGTLSREELLTLAGLR